MRGPLSCGSHFEVIPFFFYSIYLPAAEKAQGRPLFFLYKKAFPPFHNNKKVSSRQNCPILSFLEVSPERDPVLEQIRTQVVLRGGPAHLSHLDKGPFVFFSGKPVIVFLIS